MGVRSMRGKPMGSLRFADPDTHSKDSFVLRVDQRVLLETLTTDDPVTLPFFRAISIVPGDLWPDADPGTKSGNGDEAGWNPVSSVLSGHVRHACMMAAGKEGNAIRPPARGPGPWA